MVCCFFQAARGWKQPSASRMGFSSEGGVAFPWSGLSTLPQGDLEDRGEEREAGLNDLLTRG